MLGLSAHPIWRCRISSVRKSKNWILKRVNADLKELRSEASQGVSLDALAGHGVENETHNE